MSDSETVIKAVEYLNWYFTQDDGTADKNAVKAWEVLNREQEPKWIDYEDRLVPLCGNCESLLDDVLYCPRCGKKVKWDDAE